MKGKDNKKKIYVSLSFNTTMGEESFFLQEADILECLLFLATSEVLQ